MSEVVKFVYVIAILFFLITFAMNVDGKSFFIIYKFLSLFIYLLDNIYLILIITYYYLLSFLIFYVSLLILKIFL